MDGLCGQLLHISILSHTHPNRHIRSVEKAAELKYTDLPRLQERYAAKLEEVKKGGSAMLQDFVGPEQVRCYEACMHAFRRGGVQWLAMGCQRSL